MEHVRNALRTPGQPLDLVTRALMESRFGRDLGDVRVHTDAHAAESAAAIGANAYTVGHNVVFGEGEYAPNTMQGRRLLAHELAHTIQQHDPAAPPPSNDPAGALETSARGAARSVAAGQPVQVAMPSAGIGVSMNVVPERELARIEAEAEIARMNKEEEEEEAEEKRQQEFIERDRRPQTLSLLKHDPAFEANQVTDAMIDAPLEEFRQRERDEEMQRETAQAQEDAGRWARFSSIRVEYEQHGRRRGQIRDRLGELPARDRAILRRYGADLWPTWPTSRAAAQKNIVEALDAWAADNDVSLFDEASARETARLLNLYHHWTRGAPHAIGSIVGGGAAEFTTRFITDDPETVANVAALGSNAGNLVSIGMQTAGNRNTYAPKADVPYTPYGMWRYRIKGATRDADIVAKPPSMPRFDITQGKAFDRQKDWDKVQPTGRSFADVSMKLGLDAPGTTRYRSTADAARAARQFGLEKADRPGFQTHATASTVRGAFGVSGYQFESAHIVPQAVYRRLREMGFDVSEGRAFTTLLPKKAHNTFDSYWVGKWNAAKDAGRPITAGDVYKWVSEAVNRVDSKVIPNDVKGAINDRLRTELFSELGKHGVTESFIIVPGRPTTSP